MIWKMLQPKSVARAGAVVSAAPSHSIVLLGSDAGDKERLEWALGESSHPPNRLPQSTFLSHAFSILCFQQLQFLQFQVISAILNTGDTNFHDPQVETIECEK